MSELSFSSFDSFKQIALAIENEDPEAMEEIRKMKEALLWDNCLQFYRDRCMQQEEFLTTHLNRLSWDWDGYKPISPEKQESTILSTVNDLIATEKKTKALKKKEKKERKLIRK